MGSGGILLAAAMVASSVSPPTNPAPAAPVAAVAAAVPPPVQQAAPAPSPAVFADDSGDMQFGAPMIEAAPVESEFGDGTAVTSDPDSAEAAGGRQFNAKPGRPYPTPR